MNVDWWAVRYARPEDIPAIKRIAYQHRAELGFVNRAALLAATARREVFVAELPDGAIAGFVNWHARRDGWHTIYEIAVAREYAGRGIGRALLYAVPTPTRLKCTADNEVGNRFYAGAGMTLVATESGRKRALNVWERRVLYIHVQGNNRRIPEIARSAGMAYGTRHIETPREWPFMVDIHWKEYDWTDYLAKVNRWRPVQAMAADYEHPAQRRELYRQLRDLKAAGVLRVMVCPKFVGAVAHIPSWCIVAVSVPSEYAGFLPPIDELRGRRVHLLGGSPVKQREYTKHLLAAGVRVLSMDGNSHDRASQGAMWWSSEDGGKWKALRHGTLPHYDTVAQSARNIVTTMERTAAGPVQLELW